ncbi:MAG: hypothetical protein II227_06360, partial [Clostridia bacterium]|nr:hypothetical protein [Clostridia bacterium]
SVLCTESCGTDRTYGIIPQYYTIFESICQIILEENRYLVQKNPAAHHKKQKENRPGTPGTV